MKKIILFLCLSLLALLPVQAQLTITPNQTAAQMAQNLVGSGLVVTNPTLTCPNGASGTFTGNSSLGFNQGLILTTGSATSVSGAANASGSFGVGHGAAGDAGLNAVAGAATEDACVLQFNFVPQGDTVSFEYIFGSEEYPEWVNAGVNDVFGFFISGPGFAGPTNIALIPGTNMPVSIDNVNAGVNAQHYINNSGSPTIIYDGVTRVLKAVAQVTPCSTYTLKLAIADVGDDIYDSGVFLKKGSLVSNTVSVATLGGSVNGTSGLTTPQPYAVRGCLNGRFTFSRPTALPTAQVINYQITGTAVNGVDYATIPTSVTIPANATSVVQTITPLASASGHKTVKLRIFSTNVCNSGTVVDSVSMDIRDSLEVSLNTAGASFCGTAQPVTIQGQGDPLFSYSWSPAAGLSSTNTLNTIATTAGTQTYTLTATLPGSTCPAVNKQVTIAVKPIPVATATPSPQTICSGTATSIALSANVSGTTYTWSAPVMSGVSGGTAGSGANIIQTLTATGTSQGTAIYTITPTANGCVGTAINDTVKVNPLPVATASPSPQTICSGAVTSIALSSNLSGTTYTWTAPVMSGVSGGTAGSGANIAQTLTATGSGQGTAIYTITPTASGCVGATIKDTVKVNPLPVATASPSPQTICSGTATSIALSSNVSGTTYTWTAPVLNGVSGGAAGSGASIAQTLTATGTSQGTAIYTITPTANGCPGTAIKDTVKVNPIPIATASPSPQTICSGTATSIALSSNVSGTTYTWSAPVMNGVSGGTVGSGANIAQTLTTTGTSQGTAIYSITPTTANGCVGAVIKDTVYVKPVPVVTNNPLSQSICTGGTATVNLQSQLSGTSFTWTVTATNVSGAANGSGTSISQALTTTTNAPGTVVYAVTPSLNGCTGPATNYTVTVNPKSTGTQTTSICQGQSYSFNGNSYTTSNNTAKDTLLNQYGCDSIITLNLTVTPALTNTINPVICQGNSYTFAGTPYTTSQTGIVHTFHTTSGCDSIVTMNLTVNPALTGTQFTTICQGQSYTFNGIIYTTSNNTAKDTLQNAQGCDSFVTLNLTVAPAITHTINPVICQGNSYNFGGTAYTTSQTGIVHTFHTTSGCDSIVTMNLTVNPALTGTQFTTICQGQSYTFNGIIYTTSNNTAKDTLQNTQGCDSIVTLNLTVTPAITNTINPVICQGNSYNFGGTIYTTSQTGIVHNFPTAQGCDSVVTMNLTVSPPLTNTINPVICQGTTYTFGGTPYTTSQTGIVHTFQTAQGCDSIVTMNLTVNPITFGTQTTVRCQGQSFTFNGITYTSSNYTAKDTLVNQYGCDSIVTLNLTVNPVTTGTQTVTICQGHSYVFNGITYTASNTTALDTLVNQYGCDSIVTLNLTVTPAPTTTLTDTICLGDAYTFGPHVFTTNQNGFVHNFPTAQGCDSLVTLNLTVLNIVPQPLLIQESGCDVVSFQGTNYTNSAILNDTLYSDFGCDSIYRRIEITVHKTVAYEQRIDTVGCDEVLVNGIRYTADAQVRDTLRNQYGCDSVYRDFHIKVYKFQLDLSFTPDDPYQMERIEFTTSSFYGNNYKVLAWLPATSFSDQDAKSQTTSFTAPTQVIVRARSLDGGCEDEFRVNIDPREYSKDVAVPNAFSPNGDGLNDIFRPVLKLERAYNTMDFRVYNRYGQLVHATANMNHGWDGMYNGRPADKGVYSYKLVIYFLDGTNKVFTGEVTLIR